MRGWVISGAPLFDVGGRSRIHSRGWPSGVTSLTGVIATPMPWVLMTRWLTQLGASGSRAIASSRPDSITCRRVPSIM